MIVCSCAAISTEEIERAMAWMRAADPHTIITPGKLYRALGRRADCGSCMPLLLATMRGNANLQVPMHLRAFRSAATQEKRDEG